MTPETLHTAIHRTVLIVARLREEGAWKAYVVPVAGLCHESERDAWRTEGAQLPEAQARPFFPSLNDTPYAR